MKFKTGEDVVIRENLDILKVTTDMYLCRGETATITYCSGSYYRLDIDQGRSDWTDEMLE